MTRMCLIGSSDSGRVLMKPHIFGKLVQLADIKEENVVLVIGAGTGYSAAVLSKLAASVVALEENEDLAKTATEILLDLGIENAVVVDGPLGQRPSFRRALRRDSGRWRG